MKQIDLAGKRFGALVALRPVSGAETADHRPGWLVRCDCGKEKTVNGYNLRRGLITSCGCGLERGRRVSQALTAKEQYEDLTGQTIYRLTAVEFLGHNYWRWSCACGQETRAKAADVKKGDIKSCGCILSETAKDKIAVRNTVEHFDGTTVSRLRKIMSDPETKGIKMRPTSGGVMTWQARIVLRGKQITLGTFASREEAESARRAAEKKYYAPIIRAFDEEQVQKKK